MIMKKTFRPWQVDQSLLLPPSVHDFVACDHPAHFIRDLVRDQLDITAIVESYDEARGYPPYDPWMMTALLLYGYSRGVYSSRRLARGCEERLDFMAVTALNKPDFRTISDFRKRHLVALSDLFVQVLRLCQKAGLVELGHVALDGTKIKANASKHKAMSYRRMKKAEADLAAEVSDWLAAAEATDAREDGEYGAEHRGDEMPDWMSNKQARLEKIREAKASLEAEAQAEAEEKARRPKKYRGGRKPKTPPGTPEDKAQRNFTDPESRIMKGRDGFIQAYNAQAAVDGSHQVVVAQGLTASASDQGQLVPLIDAIEANTGRRPGEASADVGYCSESNLEALEERRVRAYLATGRQKHPDGGEAQRRGPKVEAMRQRLRRGGYRSRYRLRKQIVEPVFGQIKEARGFRQFLMRGIDKVSGEWALICTVHNILKLQKAT
jgi:transposase|tara:strand:- start:1320 stop:2630 length:1311 start_codon:yes stop_codon:yes gene_type:complete